MTNPNEDENEIMKKHFEYLKNLLEMGKLFLAGPTLKIDDPFGLIILETENEEEARQLLEQDPSIMAEIQKLVDLRPIRLSLIRD